MVIMTDEISPCDIIKKLFEIKNKWLHLMTAMIHPSFSAYLLRWKSSKKLKAGEFSLTVDGRLKELKIKEPSEWNSRKLYHRSH